MIQIIAAIDEQNALGKHGKLLCHLPLDLQHFKKTTLHHAVFMGRKTFESIGRALPERENFILTRQKDLHIPGCICVHSLEEALHQKNSEHLFIIGGGEVYQQYLSVTEKILLTKIHHTFDDADTFFPALDSTQWKITAENYYPISEKNQYPLTFVTYQQRGF